MGCSLRLRAPLRSTMKEASRSTMKDDSEAKKELNLSQIGALIDHFLRDVKNNGPRGFSKNLVKGLRTLQKTSGLENQDLKRELWRHISLKMPSDSRHILTSSIMLLS